MFKGLTDTNRRSFLKVVAGIVAAGVAAVVGLKLPGRPPALEIKKFGADSIILDGKLPKNHVFFMNELTVSYHDDCEWKRITE